MSCTWVIAKHSKLAMASICKCASTSIRSHPGFFDQWHSSEVHVIPVRIAWLRQPILRIHSAWRGFHVRTRTANWRWGLDDETLATWENFIDHTFKHNNMHWNPQVPQLTYNGTYLPTITERFENITTNFSKYLSEPLPYENRSTSIAVDLNYRREELEEKYKADLDLWESLT